MANEVKRRRKPRDLPQRTPTGLIMHILWRLTAFALILVLTFSMIAGITGKILYDRAIQYYEEDIEPRTGFTLDGVKLNQTSFIYVYDKEVGDYVQTRQLYTSENRVWVNYDEIPEDMINAVVAIEDKRFWEHKGVDWIRTAAAAGTIFLGGSVQGGSTITQQLIKNLTGENQVTVRRKVTEIFRALKFETNYSKEEILEMYLNTIYLGEGAYGIRSAASVYFDKELSELTPKECACIIGITNNPSLYDPYIFPEHNEKRTLTILQQMHEQGYIEDADYDRVSDQQLVFSNGTGKKVKFTCASCGYSAQIKKYTKTEEGYVCPRCETVNQFNVEEAEFYTYFEDQVVKDVTEDLIASGLSEQAARQMVNYGGLHIYSTIDLDVQRAVDSIYSDPSNVPATYSNQQMQSAIVVVDNETGDVVAMAGGVGEKGGSLTWSRATDSRLSPGSSIKPLTVYGPALDAGIITPGSVYQDSPFMQIDGKDWPQNESRSYSGWMIANTGLCKSLNTISIKILNDLTPAASYRFASELLGLHNLVDSEVINGQRFTDIDLAPLGMGQLTHGITVREMANAYATFPNEGVFRKARTYSKVLDSEGNVVLDNEQESHAAMSKHAAYYMTYMLQNAVLTGTGTAAQMPNTPVAGKTGTTSNNHDRWFAGFTPYYTAVVWCGYDEPEEIHLVNDRNPALVMWKSVMTLLMEDKEYREFPVPDDESITTCYICTETGMLAGPNCNAATIRLFASDVPQQTCTIHVAPPEPDPVDPFGWLIGGGSSGGIPVQMP